MASVARYCCCGGNPCDNDDPPLEVTVSWTGTPTGVNYSAGPPATIEVFKQSFAWIVWENGETKLLCPDAYTYTPSGTTAKRAQWLCCGGNASGIAHSMLHCLPPTCSPSQGFMSHHVLPTNAKGIVAGSFSPVNTPTFNNMPTTTATSNLTTVAMGATNNLALFDPVNFDLFGGTMTTTNGITVTWAKSSYFP